VTEELCVLLSCCTLDDRLAGGASSVDVVARPVRAPAYDRLIIHHSPRAVLLRCLPLLVLCLLSNLRLK
jgi:hypothetical protein